MCSAADTRERVEKFIAGQRLFMPGDSVLCAVSGGADSMALLCLLLDLKDRLDIRVAVAHFEHGIRGEASREDARFVEEFCRSRGVDCHVGHGNVPALKEAWGTSLEDAARRARYAFLEETADRVDAVKIALAHQLEDQAETVLLRLAHGAGVEGLAAMRPLRGRRTRPLLSTPRAALEAYLREAGIPWREDETNGDTAHARNLLRREVFPLLRALNPRVAEAMGRTARQMAAVAEEEKTRAETALRGRVKHTPYGAFWHLEGASPPAAESLRAFARQAGIPPLDAETTWRLQTLLPGGRMNLPGDFGALRTRERLHLLSPVPKAFPLSWKQFRREACGPGEWGDGIRCQTFDEDLLEGAVVRTRREGDLFAPLGMQGVQKLKKTLQDAGVDQPFRDILPLLAKGNRVLWAVGLRPSRDAAVGEETRKAVRIAFLGELPWEISREDGYT